MLISLDILLSKRLPIIAVIWQHNVTGHIRMQNPEHASMLSYTYISCLALEIQGLCDFVSGKSVKIKSLLFPSFFDSLWMLANWKKRLKWVQNFPEFSFCLYVRARSLNIMELIMLLKVLNMQNCKEYIGNTRVLHVS